MLDFFYHYRQNQGGTMCKGMLDTAMHLGEHEMKPITHIDIQVIPHECQRYDTVGDYFTEGKTLKIRVSELANNRMELLVVIHELIEVLLTEFRGISEKEISDFDIAFEEAREPGNFDEPGDDPEAPYRDEHCIATGVERLMASLLKVDWKAYEQSCNEQ
jgi:hypothetical protein